MHSESLYTLLHQHLGACQVLLDAFPAVCYVKDAQGQVLLLNTAAQQTLQRNAAQLQAQDWPPGFGPEEVERMAQGDARALELKSPYTVQTVLYHAPTQATRAVLLHRIPVLDEQGQAAYLLGIAIDVTERQALHLAQHALELERAALHESEERFRTLIEWSPDAVFVVQQGRFSYVNPAAIALMGAAQAEELLGSSVLERFAPESRNSQDLRLRALEREVMVTPRLEARCLRMNGQAFDAEVQGTRIALQGQVAVHMVVRDISERIAARAQRQRDEQALREAAQHTQTIVDNMVDAVITINASGLVESFNYAASRIFGYPVHEVLGRNVNMLMPEPHRGRHDSYLERYLRTGEERVLGRRLEVVGLRRDGSQFPMSLSVSKVLRGGQVTFVGLVRDETERRRYEEEIRQLAFYDPLTHLPNRRLLLDRLQHALAQYQRSGQYGALLFLDLDHFKQLNDTMGHDLGDILLQQVAQRLLDCVREADSVARFGGDEFVLLLDSLGSNEREAAEHAELVTHKILNALGRPYLLGDFTHSSTPSLGLVVFGPQPTKVDELLKKADVAMYQAKAAGRNTMRFFDPSMQATVSAHAALEKDMRQGLARGEFLLQYQPQVDGKGRVTGVEALVRWQHPHRGLIGPGEFINLAEETGLILPLGQWVLEVACAQLVQWTQHPVMGQWTMAVNVSAVQFAQASFVQHVRQALLKTGAPAQRLKLEITESMLMSDVEAVVNKMNAIKSHGVRLSLDDFGTGYSSLSYLKRLPLDQLKIDQSFVRDLLTDPNDAVIARTVVALGHSLGLAVIAEGVECMEHRDILLAMGCDAFQGYFFGRPVAAHELVKLCGD